jgi:uncharacterized SAM-binding protein YcdF (DUF218 family)
LKKEWIEAQVIKKKLISLGVPSDCILTENKSLNTYQNALYSSIILEKEKSQSSFLLITSAYHIKRAKACFRKQGFDIECFPVDRLGDSPRFVYSQFFPQQALFSKWDYLLHEIFGFIVYKAVGYI